jgi:uncharacterized protein (TIGR00156 family)
MICGQDAAPHQTAGEAGMPRLSLIFAFALLASPAAAQFVGPEAAGEVRTVAEVQEHTRLGRYVTMDGHIIDHLRGDHYTFRDDTGEIRVEIETELWRGREVTPETPVRLVGEVDRSVAGRYVWVKTLDVLP